MQTRSRLGAALVALGAVALGAGAYVLMTRSNDDAPRARSNVLPIVGDSISVLAAPELSAALRPYHPAIHARIGQRIDQMLPALETLVRRDPGAIVVNLGTNDVLQARTHRDWRDGFDRMIDVVDDVPCVVLTNVSTLKGPEPFPEVAAAINRAIAEEADEHSNFHVLDWNALVRAPNGSKLLQGDRVHPSEPGKQALARATRRVLDKNCASPS